MKPTEGYKLVKSLFGKEIEIPEEWELTNLGKISKIVRGASPRPIADPKYFGDGRGWIRISDITNSFKYLEKTEDHLSKLGESKSVSVNKGDVIMSIAATVGKPIIVNMKACVHDGFVFFSNLDKSVSCEYLYYLLISFETIFPSLGQHGTQKNINVNIVSKTKFLKPPLPEQRRIASILSGIDALIGSTRKATGKAELLKRGLMQELLARGIGHRRFRRVSWLFGKEIEIPEGWNVLMLAELSDGNPQYGSGDPALPYNSKLPRYIRITDIDDDGNLKSDEYVSANLVNNETKLLEQDDFLFARTGASVGRTFVFSKEFGRCIYAGYLIRFRLNKQSIVPKFLHYYTHGASYWIWVTSELTLGVQPNLNARQYSKLPVLLPPLPEQRKIASILSGVDAYIQKNREYSEKLERLKKGLMQKLLTGQIRVRV